MNKTVLGTILGAALLGVAKSKGSANKHSPISRYDVSSLKSIIDENPTINDILVSEYGEYYDVFVVFNRYRIIDEMDRLGANPSGYQTIQRIMREVEVCLSHTRERYPDDIKINVVALPPNSNPLNVPFYWSVKYEVWVDTGIRPYGYSRTPSNNVIRDRDFRANYDSFVSKVPPQNIENLLTNEPKLFIKPVPQLPPLFLSHSMSSASLGFLARNGYITSPSMALSWQMYAHFGRTQLIFDANAIQEYAFEEIGRFHLFDTDAFTDRTSTIKSRGKVMDFQKSGVEMENTLRRSFAHILGETRAQDLIFTQGVDMDTIAFADQTDEKFSRKQRDIHPIKSYEQLINTYQKLAKYHMTNLQDGRMSPLFRSRDQLDQSARSVLREQYFYATYPYMEAKFMGKLGLDSILAIVFPIDEANNVGEFVAKTGWDGEFITYNPYDDIHVAYSLEQQDPYVYDPELDEFELQFEEGPDKKNKRYSIAATVAVHEFLKSKGLL